MKCLMIATTVACLCFSCLADAVAADFSDECRRRIDPVEKHMSKLREDEYSLLNWGLRREVESSDAYRDLTEFVVANWQEVLWNFKNLATNNLERLLILNVRKDADADFYLKFVDRVADLAEQGLVTSQELHWTIFPVGTSYEKYLVRTYREPKTRKLVEKLLRVEKLSNDYWKDILSGEAYWRYASQVADGLWKDPLVPVWDYPIVRIALATAGALIIVIIALIWYLKKRLRGSGRKERERFSSPRSGSPPAE